MVDDIKSGKQFIVYSAIQSLSEQEMNESAQKEVTLLFLVLSYIYMKGGEVSESKLLKVLN